MKTIVAEFDNKVTRDTLGQEIARMWDSHNSQRQKWLAEKLELRNYIFATDTTTTSNSNLPWKNKTTLPKLCQIRDNLHANYVSALFPNDNWLKWEGYDKDAATQDKRKAIEAYMGNKVREGNFRTEVDKLVYDYIDYGNVFYDVEWVNENTKDEDTGEVIPGFVGPKLVRISPNDIVWNPLTDFKDSYKIVRSLKSIGELLSEAEDKPEMSFNLDIVRKAADLRSELRSFTAEDWRKATAFAVDGFGSLQEYYESNLVEILEFEGSLYDPYSKELQKNRVITVIDRSFVIRNEKIPAWAGKSLKGHVGWRLRPDNAYAMGPLDNLVGLQYRIDHLENLKADAMDLAVMPPIVTQGNVEEFTWGPGEEIIVGEGGSITELGKNINGVIGAANEIANIEAKMEELAGAPKQAMGIRTPGEKTAFEVQTLDQASSRIFQAKITNFEINGIEPGLNSMLEVSKRNMDGADLVRVMDDDLGVAQFMNITKADITAAGKLRPIGARHFAAQATLVQNIMGFLGSPVGQDEAVKVHLSGKRIAQFFEEFLGLERFSLYQDNVRVIETAETAQFVDQASENVQATSMTPSEAPDVVPVEGTV